MLITLIVNYPDGHTKELWLEPEDVIDESLVHLVTLADPNHEYEIANIEEIKINLLNTCL